MSTATINDTELYYVDTGSGTPVIILHGGLGFDHSYMRASLRPLEDELRLAASLLGTVAR